MQLVILDRDGVINRDSDQFIKSAQEWEPIAGSLEAVVDLNHAGYRVVIATNQSGLARGLFTPDALGQIHTKMQKQLADIGGHIDVIFFCPHGPNDHCECRKPKTGLFNEIADRFCIDLDDVPAVGDSLRDIEAAKAVGARPILVRTGKGKKTETALTVTYGMDHDIDIYNDLSAFVKNFLARA